MNAKEIEDMAYKAKFWTADTTLGGVCWMGYHAELQRFAALVAAHEREECAKVIDQEVERVKPLYSVVAENAAKAIRARNNP